MAQGKKNSGIGCLVVIGLLLCVGLIISGIRFFQDKSEYKKSHAAYLLGNCPEVIKVVDGFVGKFRPIDFAKVVDGAEDEKAECKNMLDAQELQAERKIPDAFLLYYGMLTANPQSPLISSINTQVSTLFSTANISDLASVDICTRADEFASSGTIPDQGQNIPKLLIACSQLYSAIGETDQSLDFLLKLMDEYPDSSLAKNTLANLFKYPDACIAYHDLAQRGLIPNEPDSLAQFLYHCAENSYSGKNYADAVLMYESLLTEFPDHPLSTQIQTNYADAMIQNAISQGAGVIEQPDASGYTVAGKTVVEIQNDSPERIKLVFNGPETRIEYLEPCETCQTYSMIGPLYCPEKGPIGKYSLNSGEYQVLVEASSDKEVTPFVGSWTMESGRQFYSCFYILTTWH